jgi:hypothetical protein
MEFEMKKLIGKVKYKQKIVRNSSTEDQTETSLRLDTPIKKMDASKTFA